MYDVAVIGAGPVGSRTARRLSELGLSTVVIDAKLNHDEPVCCTGIISVECLEQFEIPDSLVIKRLNGARFFSPSGEEIRLTRSSAQACVVDRPSFNEHLAIVAQAKGAEYRLGYKVTGLAVGNDSVKLSLNDVSNSADEAIESRTAIIAAGPASKLVSGIGLTRVADFAMGAQAEVEIHGAGDVELFFGKNIAPGLFAWMAPLDEKRAFAGLLARRRAPFYMRKLLSSLAENGKIVSADVSAAFAVVPLYHVPQTYSERLLLVGSAAGQVKPATGGGIFYGMLCADIAAGVLKTAFDKADFSAKMMSAYEKKWQKALAGEMRMAAWGRKFFEKLSDRRINSIFKAIKSNGIDTALLEAGEVAFDWHSGAVLKIISHKALTGVMSSLRIPFPAEKNS